MIYSSYKRGRVFTLQGHLRFDRNHSRIRNHIYSIEINNVYLRGWVGDWKFPSAIPCGINLGPNQLLPSGRYQDGHTRSSYAGSKRILYCAHRSEGTTLGGSRNQIEAGGRDDESRDDESDEDESEEDEPEEEDSEEKGLTTIEWEKMGGREQHPCQGAYG